MQESWLRNFPSPLWFKARKEPTPEALTSITFQAILGGARRGTNRLHQKQGQEGAPPAPPLYPLPAPLSVHRLFNSVFPVPRQATPPSLKPLVDHGATKQLPGGKLLLSRFTASSPLTCAQFLLDGDPPSELLMIRRLMVLQINNTYLSVICVLGALFAAPGALVSLLGGNSHLLETLRKITLSLFLPLSPSALWEEKHMQWERLGGVCFPLLLSSWWMPQGGSAFWRSCPFPQLSPISGLSRGETGQALWLAVGSLGSLPRFSLRWKLEETLVVIFWSQSILQPISSSKMPYVSL